MNTVFEKFWSRHPALLYGLAALLGFYAAINWKTEILLPLFCLWLPATFGSPQYRQRSLLCLGLMFAMFFYGKVSYQLPELPKEGISGNLHFQISSVAPSQTHFGYQWIYQGQGRFFFPDDPKDQATYGKNFFCRVKIPRKGFPADRSYVIHGLLKPTSRGSYYFVVKKNTPWHPVLGSWSIAEWRYSMKKGLKKYIYAEVKNPRSAEFLAGIITGDFEDRIMRMEFGKMGLQHIMAISGFHFALIAMMLSLLLRWIAPPKMATGILIVLLSVYFVVLGGSPSISRAWVMCFIALMGFVFDKPSYALNSLGVALLFILFYDPLLCQTLGFQFSMVTTASILLWYPVVRTWLEKIFQKRQLGQMSRMSLVDQHCYCLLAVVLLHPLNSHFTHFMLNFVYNVPNTLNFNWRVSDFQAQYLIAYLCVIFLLGIVLNARHEEKRLSFAFL